MRSVGLPIQVEGSDKAVQANIDAERTSKILTQSAKHMMLVSRSTMWSRRAESSLVVGVNAALITQQNLGVRPRISNTKHLDAPRGQLPTQSPTTPSYPQIPPKIPQSRQHEAHYRPHQQLPLLHKLRNGARTRSTRCVRKEQMLHLKS
jgi:hypothetical protein